MGLMGGLARAAWWRQSARTPARELGWCTVKAHSPDLLPIDSRCTSKQFGGNDLHQFSRQILTFSTPAIFKMLNEATAVAEGDRPSEVTPARRSRWAAIRGAYLRVVRSLSRRFARTRLAGIKQGDIPRTIDALAFQRRCLRVLRKNGWKVDDLPMSNRPVIGKSGTQLLLMFRPPSQLGDISVKYDWAEQNNWKGMRLVVINYEEADAVTTEFARDSGITLICYWELHKVEELLTLPPACSV